MLILTSAVVLLQQLKELFGKITFGNLFVADQTKGIV